MKKVKNADIWTRREGELFCEDVPLEKIARKVGTPVYVYSYQYLVDRFREMDRAWGKRRHFICYSFKANSSMAVACSLISQGAGVDVVSGGEFFRALRAGAPAEKIVFAGVGKNRREIEDALEAGILFFTVESTPELRLINEVAGGLQRTAPVALRVTPDVDPQTHKYITTGKAENKFGLDLVSALDFYRECRELDHVDPVGLHMHIGSQILQTGPYVEGVRKLVGLLRELRQLGIKIKYLDIGGGMGIDYQGETPPRPRDYVRAIAPLLKGLKVALVLEPGRSLTANAGCLLVRVRHLKNKAKKDFVIVDGAMNDLIRPALYGAHHRIVSVGKEEEGKRKFDVVGPVCETGDFLGTARLLPELEEGEVLAVMSAGAYGYVMSSNYNSRPRPAEVMVKGGEFWVVRKRETYNDLVRGETLPGFLK